MKAEFAKVRYLLLPRYTAALVAAVVVITGIVLFVVAPSTPSKYIDIPDATIGTIIEFAAIVFGVWLSTLEFSAGTMQRLLTAEPNRARVLTDKLAVVILATLVGGILVAAAAGGFSHLAATRAHVHIDNARLAGTFFGAIPSWIAGSIIGFGARPAINAASTSQTRVDRPTVARRQSRHTVLDVAPLNFSHGPCLTG